MMPTMDDLDRACDYLVQRTRCKIPYNGELAWQTLPSLLEQLATAAGMVDDARGSSVPKSRPPVNTAILSLLREIDVTAAKMMREQGRKPTRKRVMVCRCAPYRACNGQWHGYRRGIAEIVVDVRALVAGLRQSTEREHDWPFWLETLNRWRVDARRALGLDSGRRQWAHGQKCPQCQSATAWSSAGVQTAALAVTWSEPLDGLQHIESEWKVRAIECRNCQATWWRGDEMDALLQELQVTRLLTVADDRGARRGSDARAAG